MLLFVCVCVCVHIEKFAFKLNSIRRSCLSFDIFIYDVCELSWVDESSSNSIRRSQAQRQTNIWLISHVTNLLRTVTVTVTAWVGWNKYDWTIWQIRKYSYKEKTHLKSFQMHDAYEMRHENRHTKKQLFNWNN